MSSPKVLYWALHSQQRTRQEVTAVAARAVIPGTHVRQDDMHLPMSTNPCFSYLWLLVGFRFLWVLGLTVDIWRLLVVYSRDLLQTRQFMACLTTT